MRTAASTAPVAPAAPAMADYDIHAYNDSYAGTYAGEGEVMTYDGSFMPTSVGTMGGMSMHDNEQHDVPSIYEYESSLMVDGIGNSQF